MEPTPQEQTFGLMANATLLFPMAPQLMDEKERDALAGAHFGWDLLGGHLYPDLVEATARLGGSKADAALRAKVQTWLSGWVEPEPYCRIHHPIYASGQWWRLFRTTMFVEQDLAEAHEAARTMKPEDLEKRYAHLLGLGARDRFKTHQDWWANALTVIRAGSWHTAIYSPRHQAFVSPFIFDEKESQRPIDDLRAEWPRPVFRLYTTGEEAARGFGAFDLARMIQSGAMIELYGSLMAAPPFGQNWGEGVVLDQDGGNKGALIAGVIHAFRDGAGREQRRIILASEGKSSVGVSLDGPDAFRLVQAIHAVTGMTPQGVSAELMRPDRLSDLVATAKDQLTGRDGDTPFVIPKTVFETAISIHPGLTPVFGRVASVL